MFIGGYYWRILLRPSLIIPAPFLAGLIAVSSPLVFLAAFGVIVIVGFASLRPAIILFLAFIAGSACGLREQTFWNTHQLPVSSASNGIEGPVYLSGLVLEAHPFLDILIAPDIRLRLSLHASSVTWHPGDLIVFRGQMVTPAYPRNPNDFNEARFLRHQGIAGTVQSMSSVIIDHRSHDTVKFTRWRLQQWIGRRIEGLFPDQAPRALVHAMILGDRTHLDLDLKDSFRQSGLVHLLAISGLHFGCITLILVGLFESFSHRLPLRPSVKRWASIVLISLSLASFAWIVGYSASVLRGLIMSVFGLVAWGCRRNQSLLSGLSIAFVVLLVFNPNQIEQVGFQLSFLAVSGIAIGLKAEKRFSPTSKFRKVFRSSFWISACATTFTAPIVLNFAGFVPLITLVLSPIAIMVASFALTTAVIALLAPLGAFPLALVSSVAFNLLEWMVDASSATDFFPVWRQDALGVKWVVAIPILFLAQFGFDKGRAKSTLLIFTLFALAWLPFSRSRSEMNILFLDIGQGDAAILSFANKNQLIVDTGPGPGGARAISRHLSMSQSGDARTLLLTHAHSDHVGGLKTLVSRSDIDTLYHAGWLGPSNLQTANLQTANREIANDAVKALRRGDTIDLDPDTRIYILHPSVPGTENDDSIVFLVIFGDTRILFMGDVEKKAEQLILRYFSPLLQANVVKIAHHGSATSSSGKFISKTVSNYAIVSAGRNNRFSHPDPTIVQNWKNSGARVMQTAIDGGLLFRSDGKKITRIRWARQ